MDKLEVTDELPQEELIYRRGNLRYDANVLQERACV